MITLRDFLSVVESEVHIMDGALAMVAFGKACSDPEYFSNDLLQRRINSIKSYDSYIKVWLSEEKRATQPTNVLYVVHGDTWPYEYGDIEHLFGVYTTKEMAEATRDLKIKEIYEKAQNYNYTKIHDISDVKVNVLEIEANNTVDIELGGWCE